MHPAWNLESYVLWCQPAVWVQVEHDDAKCHSMTRSLVNFYNVSLGFLLHTHMLLRTFL